MTNEQLKTQNEALKLILVNILKGECATVSITTMQEIACDLWNNYQVNLEDYLFDANALETEMGDSLEIEFDTNFVGTNRGII